MDTVKTTIEWFDWWSYGVMACVTWLQFAVWENADKPEERIRILAAILASIFWPITWSYWFYSLIRYFLKRVG